MPRALCHSLSETRTYHTPSGLGEDAAGATINGRVTRKCWVSVWVWRERGKG
jgi:hypothetical protein